MKRWNRRLLLLLLIVSIGSLCWGQNPAQPQPLTAQTLSLPMLNPPVKPSSVIVSQVGAPGPSSNTYYFWLVSDFPVGNSNVAGPFPCYNGPITLNGSNYCAVSWQPGAGAVTYDLLMTTNSTVVPTGACACAVSVATSSTAVNVQSNSLSAYTVNTLAPASMQFQVSNEAVGANNSQIVFRQNGVKQPYTPVESTVNQTGKTASIGNTALIAANSFNAATQWAINWYLDSTTTCATPGPAAVTLTISFTDEVGARTVTSSSVTLGATGATNQSGGSFSI